MNYFTSDFHLGHRVLVPKYRNFSSQDEHDSLILDMISKLKKRDILYILGDFIFDSERYDYYIQQMNKMSCRIKLVMGNHDSLKMYKQDIAKNIEIQLPLFSYKNMWVSHCPIHEEELRNRDLNIHGHLHGGVIDSDRYFNVNLDNNNFKLVTLDEIKARQKYVQDNILKYTDILSDDICS